MMILQKQIVQVHSLCHTKIQSQVIGLILTAFVGNIAVYIVWSGGYLNFPFEVILKRTKFTFQLVAIHGDFWFTL